MKKVLVLLTVLVLAGCEPFPTNEPPVPPAAEQPTKTKETPASSSSPNASPSTDKTSDAVPSTSNTPSTTDEMAPTVKKVTPTSISTESVPVPKPEKPDPVVEFEPEEPDPVIVPNAGKLQIIGTSGNQVYYMKKVEQPDANCYVVSNSVTWYTSVSCVPAVNKPPVTTGK